VAIGEGQRSALTTSCIGGVAPPHKRRMLRGMDRSRKARMTASFSVAVAAAIAFLMTAPVAAAFQVEGKDGPPAAGDNAAAPNVPAYEKQNLSDRQAVTRGMTSLGTTKLGNTTIHFGASRPGMFERNNNSPFLDNPAARTVPSQR